MNTSNSISAREVSENFSKAARIADEYGTAVILNGNTPRYLLVDYAQFQSVTHVDDETANEIVRGIIQKHILAFEELAK
ncbi:MAG: type II toxin-antitoxin system Phd/YefM family antitoxin [Oscillospiraceae bacterium]|jgi:antitoxin Phd|nr:type II toxin-antitoxin system Phd/YefM family antitoxin [Oscillospiraceae bacterium]